MNCKMKLSIKTLLAILVLATPAYAQTSASRYQSCIRLVETDPGAAFEEALIWASEGGGAAARHCTALALVAQGAEEEGATRLEALAQDPGAGGAALRADLLAQAASAWILAAIPGQAERVLTRAIGLSAANPQLYLARAEALALQNKDKAALADVNRAIKLNPLEPEAYIFRASLLQKQGKNSEAFADLAIALNLAPRNLNALMERGQLYEASGNRAAARKDYIAVLTWGEEGPSVVAARAALERLDVKVN